MATESDPPSLGVTNLIETEKVQIQLMGEKVTTPNRRPGNAIYLRQQPQFRGLHEAIYN